MVRDPWSSSQVPLFWNKDELASRLYSRADTLYIETFQCLFATRACDHPAKHEAPSLDPPLADFSMAQQRLQVGRYAPVAPRENTRLYQSKCQLCRESTNQILI